MNTPATAPNLRTTRILGYGDSTSTPFVPVPQLSADAVDRGSDGKEDNGQ